MTKSTGETKCGTTAGYKKHRKNKQEVCSLCQEAYSKYMKEYRSKNAVVLKEKRIAYREKNKETIAEKDRLRHKANPQRNKESSKRWLEKNRERQKETLRNWYYNNKERNLENGRKWRKQNLEKARKIDAEASRKRRAIKNNNQFEPYTEKEVLSLYGNECHICKIAIDLNAPRWSAHKGFEMGLHIDHLVPLAKGGPDTLENVRPSHAICNLRKGAK